MLAGLLVALAAAAAWRFGSWPRWAGIGLTGLVCAMLLVPAVLLQVGLRDATEPWYFTNDSTYQIELAGDLVLDGDDPYGHDYDGSGLERFYPAADNQPEGVTQVALEHFAYFPGTALTAAAWRLAPRPFDDYRIFVLLATLALLPAALLFPGALHVRLAAGAALAANPLIVHGAWFGTADAPALLALVLAFALLARGHLVWAAASLGAALALKQFALVAVPFFAVMLLTMGVPAPRLLPGGRGLRGSLPRHGAPVPRRRPGSPLGRHGRLRRRAPIASSATAWRRSCSTLGLIDGRFDYYPFVPLALAFWLPLTAWLLWSQRRAATLWPGAAGFSISMFVLLFLSRVFQSSYLVWPLTGIAVAFLPCRLSLALRLRLRRPDLPQANPRDERVDLVPPNDVEPQSVGDDRRVLAGVKPPHEARRSARSGRRSRSGRP